MIRLFLQALWLILEALLVSSWLSGVGAPEIPQ
jgi:hypothetical protein